MDKSVKSRSTYVAARMVPISRSRSGAKTNTPDTYCTGPSTRHSTLVESEPTTTALRSNSHAAAGLPYTDIDSFFVPDPTSQPFAGWSGVMVRRNFFKKRECSTGTTANKDRNYIDNSSSLSPALRRTVWRLERKTTSPSRRWCQ